MLVNIKQNGEATNFVMTLFYHGKLFLTRESLSGSPPFLRCSFATLRYTVMHSSNTLRKSIIKGYHGMLEL